MNGIEPTLYLIVATFLVQSQLEQSIGEPKVPNSTILWIGSEDSPDLQYVVVLKWSIYETVPKVRIRDYYPGNPS